MHFSTPRRGDTAELLTAIDQYGFVILPALLHPDEVARLRADLDPWFKRTPPCEGDFYGWKTTRLGGLFAKSTMTRDMAMKGTILAIVDELLRPSADCIQINLTEAIRVHPGERAQIPHRDEEMWPTDKLGQWIVNVMWALDDFTEENGATRLWPGSHKTILGRGADSERSVPAIMKAGSALIYVGSLTHGAGANTTAKPRTGIVISYCLGWLKQYENQYLAYPKELVRSFPERLQRLIGYQIHRPNLGGVNGRDPILALDDDTTVGGFRDALPPHVAEEIFAHYRKPPG